MTKHFLEIDNVTFAASVKNKVNNDNKILLLSSFYNAGKARGPRYKINGKFSDNKTGQTNVKTAASSQNLLPPEQTDQSNN